MANIAKPQSRIAHGMYVNAQTTVTDSSTVDTDSRMEIQMANSYWSEWYSGWGWFLWFARGEITHADYAQMRSAISA